MRRTLLVMMLLLVPAAARAQSGFAGVVKDTSGAVLPGVTVEAASPALIEKTRSAVTDEQGRYNIVDLRPGVYSVTFSLAGFNTVKRDGIDLPSSFTATVNADLPLGNLAETITVSGQAPVVDTQNTAQNRTLSKELLEAVPTGRLPQSYTALMPGVVASAGSLTAVSSSYNATTVNFHGQGGNLIAWDGFSISHQMSDRAQQSMNQGMVEELVVTAGSAQAEQQSGGILTNVVPKDGGNQFSGQMYVHYLNENFVGDNLTDQLRAQGVSPSNFRIQEDYNPAVGGPIKKDKLWFFGSFRRGNVSQDANSRWNADGPLAWTYHPDLTRPTVANRIADRNFSGRLTWQASPKNKVAGFFDIQPKYDLNRAAAATLSPEATTWQYYLPQYITQLVWKSPINSRLYFETGMQYQEVLRTIEANKAEEASGLPVSPDLNAVGAQDLDTGVKFRSALGNQLGVFNHTKALRVRANISYVTGTHVFKTGWSLARASYFVDQYTPNDYYVSLRSGVPSRLNLSGRTTSTNNLAADLGLFAQDQWTHKRLTLSGGLRFDYYNSAVPAQDVPATRFIPELHFADVGQVAGWKDLSPRFAVSYDLFGNGKTAIKASLNRYVDLLTVGSGAVASANPVTRTVLAATRNFTDNGAGGGKAGDFVPQCNFSNPAANGECGVLSNLNFGLANPNATTVDHDVLYGVGKRSYNWEGAISVQHELIAGLGVDVTYVRRRLQGNQTVADNTRVTPADYNPYCITLPVDSRLPGGGGNTQCGYYDVSLAKVGQSQLNTTFASHFGPGIRDIYSGVDVGFHARFPNGAQLSGGTSTNHETVNSCFVVDSPGGIPAAGTASNTQAFCNVKPPFQTQLKILGVYPLPLGVRVSGSLQNVPGPDISATTTFTASNAQVAPSLGRNLSSGATGTVTLPILQPGTLYGDRYTLADVRFSKTFKFSRYRLTGSLDVFNIINSHDTLLYNTTYGSNWMFPTNIENARSFRIGGQFDF